MDARGIHGLCCKRSAGRTVRHNTLNDMLCRACVRSGVPSSREPIGLFRSDGKRPDGMTLVPWKVGRCLTWDVTCPDTLAASRRALTSITPGAAAERAALLKHTKYAAIKATHDFVPVAIETLGPINEEGTSFLCEIGERMKGVSGDPRETAYLFQRVSVIIHREPTPLLYMALLLWKNPMTRG